MSSPGNRHAGSPRGVWPEGIGRAFMLVLLTLLLSACPSLPPPDRLAFDNDSRILRGSYLGTVDTRQVPDFMVLAGDASVLAAAWPGAVDVWDLETLELVTTIDVSSHEDNTFGGLAVAADGSLVAGILNGDVHLWRTHDGSLVRRFDSDDRLGACRYCGIYALSLAPAGDLLAATGGAPRVLLFDTATGTIVRELETVGVNTDLVAFSADGTLLAATSTLSDTRYALRVWDTATYTVVFEHEGTVDHSRYPRFAISAGGQHLAVSSATKVEVFDIHGAVTVLPTDDNLGNWFVALSPDGTRLAIDSTANESTSLVVVELATSATLATFTDVLRGQPSWSADGRYLVADTKLADAHNFAVLSNFAVGLLHALELDAVPAFVDSTTYTVTGSVRIDGGASLEFSGNVIGNEGQRYLQPQARLPFPATVELELHGHPWRLLARQPYSLEYGRPVEADGWWGSMGDGTSDTETWHPFKLWRAQ